MSVSLTPINHNSNLVVTFVTLIGQIAPSGEQVSNDVNLRMGNAKETISCIKNQEHSINQIKINFHS